MTERKTISVWIVLKDGENKGKIAVQRRSKNENHFSYVCQATWSGKIDGLETAQDAVKRECAEELGKDFAENFDFSKLKFIGNSSAVTNGVNWICSNYLGAIKDNILKMAKIHDDALSEFVFISRDDAIYPLKSGKDPENNLVFFDDQYKILVKILDEF